MTEGVIPLSDPDITPAELEAVRVALQQPSLTGGPMVQVFEQAFAAYLGREHAVAFCGGQMALMMALKACGVGAGDEVIASPYSYREAVNAIALLGAQPVFSDIDYWSGALVAEKIEPRLTSRTRAIVGGNPNGHPAAWSSLRKLAEWRGLTLIEDSTEAIGSSYGGALVGTFGDCSVFDFSQPGPISCGEGGMVVTDDPLVAAALRRHRGRRPDQRASVSSGTVVAHQVGMSDIAAALGLAQLQRSWPSARRSNSTTANIFGRSRASNHPSSRQRSMRFTGSFTWCISARASPAPAATPLLMICSPSR
jgi:perosamine synthetase